MIKIFDDWLMDMIVWNVVTDPYDEDEDIVLETFEDDGEEEREYDEEYEVYL